MDKIGMMIWVVIGGLSISVASLPGQTPPGATSTTKSVNAESKKTLPPIRFPHVTVDRTAGTVTVEASVVRAQYALEFLLCKAGTKDYESVLATDAKAWQIHAGLLMLGLSPGLPAEYIDGKCIPPRGAGLRLSVHWKDGHGKQHRVEAADLFKASKIGKGIATPKRWIFVGSEILPDGQYAADDNGGIISVANLPSAVIDVPFESTKTIDMREFVVNKQALPPAGTKVQLIITPEKGADKAEYARALLEIDRKGQLKLEGQPITLEQLPSWAELYIARHKKGEVVIRSSAMAWSGYAPMAGEELRLGGVFDIRYRTIAFVQEPLPRTAEQLGKTMKIWKNRFAHPGDEVRDPAISAGQVLREIRQHRAELEELNRLWAEYEKLLTQDLGAYNKAVKDLSDTENSDDHKTK